MPKFIGDSDFILIMFIYDKKILLLSASYYIIFERGKTRIVKCRGVAQVVARLLREQEAVGSSPATPTILLRQNRFLPRKARLYRAFLLPKRLENR